MTNHTACEDTLSLVQQQRDQATARAETAEQALTEMTAHRDRCRDIAMEWQVEANRAKRRADEPRPLTPDAITDEMVRRAHAALVAQTGRPHSAATVEAVLAAALTEPPARPEGAEDIEAGLGTWKGSRLLDAGLFAEDRRDLANHIAEEMNR